MMTGIKRLQDFIEAVIGDMPDGTYSTDDIRARFSIAINRGEAKAVAPDLAGVVVAHRWIGKDGEIISAWITGKPPTDARLTAELAYASPAPSPTAWEYYVQGDRYQVIRIPRGSNCIGEQVIVAECAIGENAMQVAQLVQAAMTKELQALADGK